jgi:endonuclease/exonuclease/phosphatase family metal-dependent hydrolase
MPKRKWIAFFIDASMILFYMQALRVIFSVLFGIIYDQVFEGPIDLWLVVSNLLVVAAMIAPWLIRGTLKPSAKWLPALTALGRLFLSADHADVRFWAAIAVLLFGGLAVATQLRHSRAGFARSFIAALAVDQVLRAAGHTFDISLRPSWLPFQGLWLVLVAVGAWRVQERESDLEEGGLDRLEGLAFGGLLFLETSLLSLPHAVGRWSVTAYAVHAPLTLVITLLILLPWVRKAVVEVFRKVMVRFAAAGLLALGLMLGYFQSGAFAAVGLVVAQFTALSFIVGIFFRAGPRRVMFTGGSLALGMLLLLVLNFFNAFAFTYPYTLLMMRGMGWAVYLIAALIVGLVGLLSAPTTHRVEISRSEVQVGVLLGVAALAVCTLFALPKAARPFHSDGELRLATYNMHYGYDDDWHWTLEEIAETIESAQVDVIALQEVDAGRMTSYNADDALYLACNLGMNAVYLPTVEHLTGIAVLHRGEPASAQTRLLSSLQEQTGIVLVPLGRGEARLNFYGIWMGLSDEDTERQIREALNFIGDASPAAFGGDFNARMDEAVPQMVLARGFVDPFSELGIDPPPNTSPAIDPSGRIDYVWLRGVNARQAWVSESLSSDHRMVVVEVVFP